MRGLSPVVVCLQSHCAKEGSGPKEHVLRGAKFDVADARVVEILTVTPDSCSVGGAHKTRVEAV